MTRQKQSRGKCVFCGHEMTKGGMAKHLRTCAARTKAINDHKEPSKNQLLYHIQVQDAWHGDYWLHLEMKGSSSLNILDKYLRDIWLECCGHLSQFSWGGWGGGKIPKSRRAAEVFEPSSELTHIYDFGTSSETLIKVIDVRNGKSMTSHPIFLMARNEPLDVICMECDQPAAWLCLECIYELDEPGVLCNQHAQDHPHDDYGEPLPLVNSPRVGMCGYTGPADPPY